MRKSELVAAIIEEVERETEISKEGIMSADRRCEIVDARHLAVALMHHKDIYPHMIAAIFGISPCSVHYILSNFDNRLKQNKFLSTTYGKLRRKFDQED